MQDRRMITLDGNEAAASVAYRVSEVISLYPITPSTPMGESADQWASRRRTNIWGAVPQVVEMQSEAGAAGSVHGILQAGGLSTTFTASQGLLLMIPVMYKLAGQLLPFVMHVAARSIAAQALSIFGDHSDVMACRATGFGMLCSDSVQEAHDMALIAHAATLESRVPFLHFFDGFRISHEVSKIQELTDGDLQEMIKEEFVANLRDRALRPERPVIRGTAQNPDTFFQSREAVNPFYNACPGIVQDVMDHFAGLTGREYRLFEYFGHPEAERVVILMGSGADVVQETVETLVDKGERVGVVKVRLYRPFSVQAFFSSLPRSVRRISVLGRTKEAGSVGEPLYLDVVNGLEEGAQEGLSALEVRPLVTGGRYGLSSKDFTPAMVASVFDELTKEKPKNHFTIGINDDVTFTSLAFDPAYDIEPDDVVRSIVFGLGSDGTVSANKNSVKIIGETTDLHAQGYFVYDSKKSGGVTTSHLRFGPRPIRSHYLIRKAGFVACHQYDFLERFDVLDSAAQNAVFLLNSPVPSERVWGELPMQTQETIIEKGLRFFAVDAYAIASRTGMGQRINTIMQTCFFALAGILPREEAIGKIKDAIRKSYSTKGEDVVQKNFAAVDEALAGLHEIDIPERATGATSRTSVLPSYAPEFNRKVQEPMMLGKGDELPVSALPVDGTWPVSMSRWEKRNIGIMIPEWDPDVCIQCGRCSFVCPHSTIRMKVYDPTLLADAPDGFKSADAKGKEYKGMKFTVQVAPEDCTGCRLCVATCPAKNKTNPRHRAINMALQRPIRDRERKNWDFFLSLPVQEHDQVQPTVKGSQLLQPLFEFPGACAGCGETQYIRLMSQLFGDRALVANATGCSSIYTANLPTTAFTTGEDGRGPAWANSLFEDNAEFGLGMRLALDNFESEARRLLSKLAPELSRALADEILHSGQESEFEIRTQRSRVALLKQDLAVLNAPEARSLLFLADYLVKKSVWIIGGDGWAYDIGFGGLDHVLSLGRNVNILVLDTEIYSNTGGQQSKASPLGAAAKFAASGKDRPKKDLGLMAMTYGSVYVGRVAFGADDKQTVRTFLEAESYPGTSLIIAYSHCIGHGYDLALGGSQQKLAVQSGYWPLYRFDPNRKTQGLNPLQLDSGPPTKDLSEYMYNEARYRMLRKLHPDRGAELLSEAKDRVRRQYALYEKLSRISRSQQTETA